MIDDRRAQHAFPLEPAMLQHAHRGGIAGKDCGVDAVQWQHSEGMVHQRRHRGPRQAATPVAAAKPVADLGAGAFLGLAEAQ